MMDARMPYAGSEVSCGKVVPLISSSVAGPIGLMHLPRMWLKALLRSMDLLAEDWGCGAGGLDRRTSDTVGLDADGFFHWMMEEFPTYEECEGWVSEHAQALRPDTIAAANAHFATGTLPRGLGPEFRAYLKIDDPTAEGITLNNYDDWFAIDRLLARYGSQNGELIPAISPRTTGLLKVPQLPRLWLKGRLRRAGALPADYRFEQEPTDREVLDALGIGPAREASFVARERPTYVEYEHWIRAHAEALPSLELDPAAVEAVERYDRAFLHRTLAARRGQSERPGLARSFNGRR